MAEYRRRFSPDFNGGIEAGSSYFSSNFNRTMVWAQPYVTWFASPYTSLKLKLGVSHRAYNNFADSLNTNRRFDYYGLEFESWPTYNWQIKASLFSSLDKFPAVNEQFSTTVSAGYVFTNGSSITAKAGIEHPEPVGEARPVDLRAADRQREVRLLPARSLIEFLK